MNGSCNIGMDVNVRIRRKSNEKFMYYVLYNIVNQQNFVSDTKLLIENSFLLSFLYELLIRILQVVLEVLYPTIILS